MNKAEQWYTGCDRNDGTDHTGGPVLEAATRANRRRNQAKYGDRYDGTGLLKPERAEK